jgi:hypothetical protein
MCICMYVIRVCMNVCVRVAMFMMDHCFFICDQNEVTLLYSEHKVNICVSRDFRPRVRLGGPCSGTEAGP